MEPFEIQTKNRTLRTLHKILLATGILALVYLVMQLMEANIDRNKNSSSGK